MSELDLDAIEARAKAATPGPWQTRFIYRMFKASRNDPKAFMGTPPRQDWVDSDFIAHSREDVPALIAELRKLREENARLEELLNRAARIASELTGFPWPLPAPPEVKP